MFGLERAKQPNLFSELKAWYIQSERRQRSCTTSYSLFWVLVDKCILWSARLTPSMNLQSSSFLRLTQTLHCNTIVSCLPMNSPIRLRLFLIAASFVWNALPQHGTLFKSLQKSSWEKYFWCKLNVPLTLTFDGRQATHQHSSSMMAWRHAFCV